MTSTNRNFPVHAGNVTHSTVTQVAERAIDLIAGLSKRQAYAIHLSNAGRVEIDRLADMVPDMCVMACTSKSDPDVLAEELRFAWRTKAVAA